jgi:predicted Zn-ribbon and HTH transcriptional regulator
MSGACPACASTRLERGSFDATTPADSDITGLPFRCRRCGETFDYAGAVDAAERAGD